LPPESRTSRGTIRASPTTFHGFGDFSKQLRIQFYFGLAESLCGDKKAADRRWSRIAKAKAPATSGDFAFPAAGRQAW
jgi:hypothetical protein